MQKRDIERLLKKLETVDICRKSLLGLRYGTPDPAEVDKRLREARRLTGEKIEGATLITMNYAAADALREFREALTEELATGLGCHSEDAVFKAKVKVDWPIEATGSIY